ncbi:hypothetical protein CAter282_2892 [Collimonas arenae]|uniref:Uncharacterized protein n=2 Tax=Collimonas arenae TaxID=279058 RepID=A0A127QLD8_9BURK|nr:hypothetical protein CAter282_2892 [Collimonas arenae]
MLKLSAAVCIAVQPIFALALQTDLKVNVIEQKKNATVTIDQGMVGAIGGGNIMNGITATTTDFKGQALPAFILFDKSVTEARLAPLASFQGRISGTVDCKLVQLGNSPDIPYVKLAVLAQDCTIKALNH